MKDYSLVIDYTTTHGGVTAKLSTFLPESQRTVTGATRGELITNLLDRLDRLEESGYPVVEIEDPEPT